MLNFFDYQFFNKQYSVVLSCIFIESLWQGTTKAAIANTNNNMIKCVM